MSQAQGIQSSPPDKVDPSVASIKGHDYYKDTFLPPKAEVTDIDPRDKVSHCEGSPLNSMSWTVVGAELAALQIAKQTLARGTVFKYQYIVISYPLTIDAKTNENSIFHTVCIC